MYGDHTARLPVGTLTITAVGYSLITAGSGVQVIPGVGVLTITADGITATFTAGYGCREMSGLLTGSPGGTAAAITPGILPARGFTGEVIITDGTIITCIPIKPKTG